jgi:hypothetical protein
VYGSPRVCRALSAKGESVSENTAANVMRQCEIRAKTKRKFVPCTTDANRNQPVAENLPDRQFAADLPTASGRWTSPTSPPPKAGCTWPG